jgi:LPXTG-motif cell wall-anchored protein
MILKPYQTASGKNQDANGNQIYQWTKFYFSKDNVHYLIHSFQPYEYVYNATPAKVEKTTYTYSTKKVWVWGQSQIHANIELIPWTPFDDETSSSSSSSSDGSSSSSSTESSSSSSSEESSSSSSSSKPSSSSSSEESSSSSSSKPSSSSSSEESSSNSSSSSSTFVVEDQIKEDIVKEEDKNPGNVIEEAIREVAKDAEKIENILIPSASADVSPKTPKGTLPKTGNQTNTQAILGGLMMLASTVTAVGFWLKSKFQN